MSLHAQIEQGISLHRQGKLKSAAALYQEVLSQDNNNADALHYLGLINYQMGNAQQADDLISRALQINPACANTLSDLGMVKVEREQYKESLPLFVRSLQLNPNHIDAMNNMAIALKKLLRYEQTIPLYERLAKLQRNSAQVLCDLADAQYQVNRLTDAIGNYQKAIKLEPDNKHARVGLGDALESAGKFKQARLQYFSALRRDSNSPLALSKLLQLREGEVEDKWVELAHELIESSQTESEGKIRLNVALGYYYDRQKEYDKAFRHLKLGYDSQAEKEPFDSVKSTKSIDSLIDVFSEEFCRSKTSPGNTSERPVFILGMPRSGTTLTEQILASHSQVAAGGELSVLLQLAYQAQELSDHHRPYPYCMTDISRFALLKLAKTYLDRLDNISSTAAMVTDKLPFNFVHIGLIAMLFPNAKIIHCRRYPLDNCLSCYFTSFADQIKFANNLQTLGQYYLDYDRLMKHWHRVLPIKIFDLQYEELIGNTEQKVRALLDYCQLDWEDSCLSFYETKRGVRTPSRWQVRQPIYSSSMQRWRHYETALAPLKEVLTPILEGYE